MFFYLLYFSEMPILTIYRQPEWMNRFRMVRIYIDNEYVGSISSNSSREFTVTPGKHTVEGRIDWCSSETISLIFDDKRGQIVSLQGPKFEKSMIILSTLIGVVLSYYMIFSSVSKTIFFAAFVPVVGYRLYYFTLGRNSFIQAKVLNENEFRRNF